MSGIKDGDLDPIELEKVLKLALSRLHAELTSPSTVPVGAPVTASIMGAGTEIDVSDLLNGVLDLAWLSYTALDLGNIDPSKTAAEQMAALAATALPTAKSVPPASGITQVPLTPKAPTGTLNRLLGIVGQARLRVRVDVQWRLRDHKGKDWVAGQDFLAPNGLNLANVTLLIPPIFQELRFDPKDANKPVALPLGCNYYLSAKVSLSVGTTTVSADLPGGGGLGIPLAVLPILLPTVAAVFSNRQFNPHHPKPGLGLVIVPYHSPLGSLEQLSAFFDDLNKKIEPLRSLAGFASALLGLDALTSAINTHPAVRFTRALEAPDETPDPDKVTGMQGVSNFEKIVFWREPTKIWFVKLWEDNITMNDRTNSALLLGLPGTVLRLYVRRFYEMDPTDADNGAFEMFIPSLVDPKRPLSLMPFTLVPDFSNLDPATKAMTPPDAGHMFGVPRTIPPGRSRTAGGGWATEPNDPTSGWRDKISSVVFHSFGTASQCSEVPPPPVG